MRKSFFSVIGCIISLFFSAIVLLILFGYCRLYLQPLYILKTVFAVFNLLVLWALLSFKGGLTQALSLPYYMAIITTAVIYTVMQFVLLAVLFFSFDLFLYLILQLILLFITGVIITVFAQRGINNSKR